MAMGRSRTRMPLRMPISGMFERRSARTKTMKRRRVNVVSLRILNKILSETTFTLLLFIVFVLALRRSNIPLIGILSGILVLLRPIAIGYFAVLCVGRLKPVLRFVLLALA